MAGEATIGALRVVLGADTAKFEENLKSAVGALDKFGAAVKAALAPAAVVAGLTAITAGILKTTESIDQLGKAAQKIGIPVEELSGLKYAAGLADVSMEALSAGMIKLARNMSAVAGGAKGPAADAFRALSISVTDANGNLKSTGDVFGDLADKFAGFKDSAAKTALETAIFGKGAADLIPLLNQGKKGLSDAADEARKFGLIVSEEAAKSAELFNDNLKRLSAIMQGVMITATSQLSGELAKLSDTMVEVGKSGNITGATTTIVTGFMRGLGLELVALEDRLGKIVIGFKFLGEEAAALASGNFAAMPAIFDKYSKATTEANTATVEQVKSLLGLQAAAGPAGDELGKLAASVEKFAAVKTDAPILATKTALDGFIESTKKSIAAQQAEFDTFGMAAGAREKAKLMLEAFQIAQANNITLSTQQKAALDALGVSLETINQKLAAQQLLAQVQPLWDQYTQAIANARIELEKIPGGLEQVGLVNEKIAQRFGLTWEQQAASVAGSFSEIATTFAGENKKMAAIAKSLGAAQALISTYAGAAQALELPFPFNIAAAAAVLAKGLAFVASINAIGFAAGGSFKVPGGISGVDSHVMPLALSPGERVDVTPSSQVRDRRGAIDINLSGFADDDRFTGKRLRSLFEAINQGQRDGYRITFAGG